MISNNFSHNKPEVKGKVEKMCLDNIIMQEIC